MMSRMDFLHLLMFLLIIVIVWGFSWIYRR
jgi:hypothetical protein